MTGECFLCHKIASLERHHIFGGSNRKNSEKYGLVVDLCHACHNEPPQGVHHNKALMDLLHEYGQTKAMREQHWTKEDFMRVFHANYI